MLKIAKQLVLLSVVLGMTACNSMPKRVMVNEGLKKQLDGFQTRSVIFFDSQGKMVVTDVDGKRQPPCSVRPGKTQCRALTKGAEVFYVQPFTVIGSKVNPNCFATVDANGTAYEICW